MSSNNTAIFIQKASKYGLQEFLEIMGELSQESTKKGLLSRLEKELITLGLALYKDCHRCIDIHTSEAVRLKASDFELTQVKKVLFFMNASPEEDNALWDDWEHNWTDYSFSKISERRQLREMIALAISIVMQHEKQIDLHMVAALNLGLTIEKIFEIVPLVMLMDGAPTLSQIPVILSCYEKYEASTTK
jgi:AhpD family alkylhydroperoxidase